MGTVGPSWVPYWSHKPCYQGIHPGHFCVDFLLIHKHVLIPYTTDLLNQLGKNMFRKSSDMVLSESVSKYCLIHCCLFVSIRYSIIGLYKGIFPVKQQAYQIRNSVLLVCTFNWTCVWWFNSTNWSKIVDKIWTSAKVAYAHEADPV